MAHEGHFYTTNLNEANHSVTSAGYHAEGVECFVFTKPMDVPGLIPVHRFYNNTVVDHFYCTDERKAGCRAGAIANGYTEEGIAFYVRSNHYEGQPDRESKGLKWTPLYEMYSAKDTDHFYTVAQDRSFALKLGYVDVEVVGQALSQLPIAPIMAAPLYRSYKPGDQGPSVGDVIKAIASGIVTVGGIFVVAAVLHGGGYATATDGNGTETYATIPPVV